MKRMCNYHKLACCLSRMCKAHLSSCIHQVKNSLKYLTYEEDLYSYRNPRVQFASLSGISR